MPEGEGVLSRLKTAVTKRKKDVVTPSASQELPENLREGIETFASLQHPVVVFRTPQQEGVVRGLQEALIENDRLVVLDWTKFAIARGERREGIDGQIEEMVASLADTEKPENKQLLVIQGWNESYMLAQKERELLNGLLDSMTNLGKHSELKENCGVAFLGGDTTGLASEDTFHFGQFIKQAISFRE